MSSRAPWSFVLLSCGLLLAACTSSPVPQPAAVPPNILLVTLDTFRADRLNPRLTPALERLATQGVRFTTARTVAPLTLPAHVSIMTGVRPPRHGARVNGTVFTAPVDTLATRLKHAGYRTGAVVGAFVLDRRFGLAAGFDDYDDAIDRDPAATDALAAERPASVVLERATAMLARRDATAPWFQWVHFYDAHAPYAPAPEALARAGGDPYDGEIAALDEAVARLLAAVDARPDAARTVVVVVGDHGESLGAHEEATHGMLVTEAAIRVPFVLRAPGVAAATRTDAVSLVDVTPTLLALSGQAANGLDGRDLLAPAAATTEASIYAETEYPAAAAWAPAAALVQGSWKLVSGGATHLFDLTKDAAEAQDVAAAQPARARELTAALQGIRRQAVAPGAAPAAADTARQLRALGYVAAPAAAGDGPRLAAVPRDWARFEVALADAGGGRLSRALPVLADLATTYPAAPIFAASYGRALADSGRTRDALTHLRAAVARIPSDWTLFHELAAVARTAGLAAEAQRAEDAALALNPQEPSALNGRALLLIGAGDHAAAADLFARAVAADPTNAVYQANLGNARRALGDLDGASAAYRAALERAPDLGDASNGLGVVLVQQQRAAEAVPWLERAARDPEFREAQLNLGIALQQSGQRERAAAQYRRIAAQTAPSAERDAARALLAQLGRP